MFYQLNYQCSVCDKASAGVFRRFGLVEAMRAVLVVLAAACAAGNDGFDCTTAQYTAVTACADYTDTANCTATWEQHSTETAPTFAAVQTNGDSVSYCPAVCSDMDTCFDLLSTLVDGAAPNGAHVIGWVSYRDNEHTLNFAVSTSCSTTITHNVAFLEQACNTGFRSSHGTFAAGRRRQTTLTAYNNRFDASVVKTEDDEYTTAEKVGIGVGAAFGVLAVGLAALNCVKHHGNRSTPNTLQSVF